MRVSLTADRHLTASTQQSRQNNLGFIRLVLASLVLLSHSPELVDGNRSRELLTRVFHTLSFGELAVDGFFLVSGALITASFLNSSSGFDYLVKRILRIYPGYIVVFLLCVFVVAPLVGGVLALESPRFWLRIVKRCLLLELPEVPGAMQGNHYPTLNGSLWTISYEFCAYLAVLFLGVTGLLRQRRLILSLAICLVLAYSLDQSATFHGRIAASNPALAATGSPWFRFFGLFAAGAAFHLFREHLPYRGRWVAIAIVVLLASMTSNVTAHAGVATAGAYLLFFAAWRVHSRTLSGIGSRHDLSYGVYLYAWPVQSVLIWHYPGFSPWVLLVMSISITAVMACLSWNFIERPALRFKHAFTNEAVSVPEPVMSETISGRNESPATVPELKADA